MPPGIAVLGDSTSIGIHLAILKKCGFPVRLLWMPSEPMLRSIATQFEIPQMATTEDAAMLAVDVGIIVIGLEPTHQHRIVSKAIGIGKHVVCLPPSDIRKEGVVEMLNSAKYYPQVIGSLGSLRATNEFLYGQKNNSQQQEELILQESLSDAEELVQYSPERVPTSLYVQGLMNFFQQLRESFKDSGVGSPTSSWSKDSMTDAVSFDDYHQIQSILAAFRLSHRHRRWFGVETNLIETEDVKFI